LGIVCGAVANAPHEGAGAAPRALRGALRVEDARRRRCPDQWASSSSASTLSSLASGVREPRRLDDLSKKLLLLPLLLLARSEWSRRSASSEAW
jgi:hypothetical protein